MVSVLKLAGVQKLTGPGGSPSGRPRLLSVISRKENEQLEVRK